VETEADMHQLAKALGERIRTQRKAKGFSQDALAHSCTVDRSYMGRIERGEVNITVEKLYRIANVLECEPQYLLPETLSLHELISDLTASD
jgi:transcriptional regulator with XRE-family HTH domain